jgi:DNA-binding transcriptional MerR regulator
MDNKNLFTIGKLAKITGTKVKALRYYDKIGILTPTFVDPDNGYRYYSNEHVIVVQAIRFCAEVNIPLKQFNDFISEDGRELNFLELVKYATNIANKKMRKLQEDLNEFTLMLEIMEQVDTPEDLPTHLTIPENDYWLVPYNGEMSTMEYHSTISDAYFKIEKMGIEPINNEEGMVIFYNKNIPEPYIVIPIKTTDKNADFDSIIRLPALSYAASRSDVRNHHNIPKIFPHLFDQDYEKIVFKTEILTKKINWETPVYEVLCSLPLN